MILALVHALGFTILGALTPGFITQRNATLQNKNCGYWIYNANELDGLAGSEKQMIQLSQMAQYISNGTAADLAYVRACYGAYPENSLCDVMINRRIPWTGSRDNCPFKGQCVGGDNGTAYTMDTGNVTAHYFGINTVSKLSIRKRSTCAPILMEPYQVEISDKDSVGGYAHLQFDGLNATQVVRGDFASP